MTPANQRLCHWPIEKYRMSGDTPNTEQPLVSILMNCYNGEKYLKEAIDSIYAQTYGDWEIIFWDNCSTDKSADIAKSYDDRLRYFPSDNTTELGVARNSALEKVRGEYLCFLDTDDIWLPNKLTDQIFLLKKNKFTRLCYGGVQYIDESGRITGYMRPRKIIGNALPELLKRSDINMQSVMLRYNKEYCYFNGDREFSPDHELFMRVACTYDIISMSSYLVKYRRLPNSLSKKKMNKWWVEQKKTLEMVLNKAPDLENKYPKEVGLAWAKVGYYKAILHISKNEKIQARNELSPHKSKRMDYFMLYLILFLPKFVWNVAHKVLKKAL